MSGEGLLGFEEITFPQPHRPAGLGWSPKQTTKFQMRSSIRLTRVPLPTPLGPVITVRRPLLPTGACRWRQQSRKAHEQRVTTTASLQLMDLTTLRAVLHNLRQSVLPSRFEKAQQPDPQTLQLGLRTLQGMIWIELSWQADAPRLVQVKSPERQGAGSTLAQQLQHSLRQLALVDLHQAGFERVVEFRFAARPGEVVQRTLVLELMGRHSNMLLLDAQQQVIALGRQVRDHQSRVRPIGTGDPYMPPPSLQGQPPEPHETYERWRERLMLLPISLKKALQQTYQGISPPLIRQLAGSSLHTPVHDLDDPTWQTLYQRWSLWLDCLRHERFRLTILNQADYQVWGEDQPNSHQLALQLGEWYRQHLNQRALDRLTGEVRQRLIRWREKEADSLHEQESRLSSTSNCNALQREADALLCLPNPDRAQIDRAQKLYQKARKMRRSVAVLKERILHHQQRLTLIEGSESFIDDLHAAGWENALERINALHDPNGEIGTYSAQGLGGKSKTEGGIQGAAPTT